MTDKTQIQPWWREPWPWFLMAGPALAIVGCIITIALAVTYFRGEAIVDGGVKRGLLVEKQTTTSTPSTDTQAAQAAEASVNPLP